MIETLASEKNPLFKQVRRAAGRGSLTEEGYAVAEGVHLLDEALASGLEIGAVIAAEAARSLLAQRYPRLEDSRVVTAPDEVFATLTTVEHGRGVIALVRPKPWRLEDAFRGTALAVALDGVQDPGNAGAAVRSAEAFGATGVIFLKGSVSAYNPKCLRGSAGSVFRMPLVTGVEEEALLDAARLAGARLYAALPRAEKSLEEIDWTGPSVIAIGGEGAGVRESLAERAAAVRIPTTGVESLNAAVACAVLLYEARRQRSRA